MARNYKQEDKYQSQPEQVKNRVARNAARRKLMREGKVRKGDGKDVAHKVAFDKGGGNKQGVKVLVLHQNGSQEYDGVANVRSVGSQSHHLLKPLQ